MLMNRRKFIDTAGVALSLRIAIGGKPENTALDKTIIHFK